MSSNSSKLQIKLLSPAGELLNCINCYSAQVSVFRAASPSELQPYLRVLGGTQGPDRLVVSLDGESYRTEACTLIGYGERFTATDGTVAQFLAQHRVPEDSIEPLLLNYGLENIFHTACASLSKCEERRLRLVAATYDTNRVLILNSPFDPISTPWREKFAELILSCARMRKKIVVVPYLAYRPECWIDNDSVARIQVGDNIQKTVGFKKSNEELGTLLKQIRSDMSEEGVAESAPVSSKSAARLGESAAFETDDFKGPAVRTKRFPGKRASSNDSIDEQSAGRARFSLAGLIARPRLAMAAALLALTLAGISTQLNGWLENRGKEENLAAIPEHQAQPEAGTQPQVTQQTSTDLLTSMQLPENNARSNLPSGQKHEPPAQIEQSLEPPQLKVVKALDLYPAHVRSAVLASFDQRSPLKHQRTAPRAGETVTKPESGGEAHVGGNEAGEFLRLLEFAGSESDSTNEVENQQPDPNAGGMYTGSSEDERREQIRQKFLEAIQRAQDRRNQGAPEP